MVPEDAAARFAAFQALSRVFQYLDSEKCESLLLAIGNRPDSLEKVQRFQVVEILNGRVQETAQEYHQPKAASRAKLWTVAAHAGANAVWKRLHAADVRPPLPSIDEVEVELLIDFMNDAELMGILGLQAGWTPDLKKIDPDLDLKSTDTGLGL